MQHARHRHAHLPPARQRAHVGVDPLVVEPEAVEDFARLRLERVAAEVLVFLLHFAEAGQNAVHVPGLLRIAHRVIEPLELVMQIADAAAAENRLVQHRAARAFLDVLPEVADRQLLRDRNLAVVGHFFAGDQAEQGRLAGSVRADQPDCLAGIELERGVDEEDLPAVLLADAGQRNHATFQVYCGFPARGPRVMLQCRPPLTVHDAPRHPRPCFARIRTSAASRRGGAADRTGRTRLHRRQKRSGQVHHSGSGRRTGNVPFSTDRTAFEVVSEGLGELSDLLHRAAVKVVEEDVEDEHTVFVVRRLSKSVPATRELLLRNQPVLRPDSTKATA